MKKIFQIGAATVRLSTVNGRLVLECNGPITMTEAQAHVLADAIKVSAHMSTTEAAET